MFFGWKSSKYKQESELVFNSAVFRAENAFNDLFAQASSSKEIREQKFEAISVFLCLYIWSLQKHESVKKYHTLLERIYETMFDRYDVAVREQGVSDVRVGPTIRALASKFRGRMDVYGESFENKDGKELASRIAEKGICSEAMAKQLAITLIVEAQKIQNMDWDAWFAHLEHPVTGKYEPHEGVLGED